uniref:Innexin n=1 Tax=Angiostrongylus cantonensis TaxID=6313 RepID=A0A0K0D823_ANGCA
MTIARSFSTADTCDLKFAKLLIIILVTVQYQVRVLGNSQRYSIQCVLSLNMFNEKIFLFLYFWFIVVGFVTAIDAINLAYYTRVNTQKLQYVQRYVSSFYIILQENSTLLGHRYCPLCLQLNHLLRFVELN